MYRILPLFLFSACGVFGLSSEEADQLASYKERAQTYWDDGDLVRAYDQTLKGLAIAPDDYKLLTIRAWCVLRLSGKDEAQQALTLFERLMEMRSMGGQSHQALLGYGLCLERVGLLQRQEVELLETRLDHESLDPMEHAEVAAKASEHRGLAQSSFLKARRVLQRLLDNGEELMLANKALMEVNGLLPNYQAAVEHGEAYLVESEKVQGEWRTRLEETMNVGYEQHVRTQLGQLRREEIEVRAYLANIHSKRATRASEPGAPEGLAEAEWEKVVEQLDIVLDMDTKRSIDYYHRANSLRQLRDYDKAKADFATFLQMTNLPAGDPRVREAVRAIEGILAP